MAFDQPTAIDISSASEDEIDYLLDRLYTQGYLTPAGTAPAYYDMEEAYIDRNGTTPSYIVCYIDNEGYATVEACDDTSPRSARLLSQSRRLSIPRAIMILGH